MADVREAVGNGPRNVETRFGQPQHLQQPMLPTAGGSLPTRARWDRGHGREPMVSATGRTRPPVATLRSTTTSPAQARRRSCAGAYELARGARHDLGRTRGPIAHEVNQPLAAVVTMARRACAGCCETCLFSRRYEAPWRE